MSNICHAVTISGNIHNGITSQNECLTCDSGYVRGTWNSGCGPEINCGCGSGDILKALPATAYPYKNIISTQTIENYDKDESIIKVKARVEWLPSVPSKYYKINVFQNNDKTIYYSSAIEECKQVFDIEVLFDIPANILIQGFENDVVTDPHQKENEIYKTRFTIKKDDDKTYSYENLTTLRRKDHENNSYVYESSLSEGVCVFKN